MDCHPFSSASSKAGLAVLGQALFAGSHFCGNIFLARWLSAAEYGAFALAFACFLLFSMLYSACIYEPMIVFGSSRYANSFQGYLGLLVRSNLAMLAAVSVSMLAVSFLLGLVVFGQRSACICRPCCWRPLLSADLARARRFLRSTTTLAGAAAGRELFYFSILIGVLFLLQRRNQLSPVTAFLGMGLAGLVSAAFLLIRLGFHWRAYSDGLTLRAVTEDHWRYGKWAMASAVVAWFPDNIYYARSSRDLWARGERGSAGVNQFDQSRSAHPSRAICCSDPNLSPPPRPTRDCWDDSNDESFTRLVVPTSMAYTVGSCWFRAALFQLFYKGKYREYSGLPMLLGGHDTDCCRCDHGARGGSSRGRATRLRFLGIHGG